MQPDTPISITAPAKVNLFLHVTRKRSNGYHDLQSLVAFSDFGDTITITPAKEFSFSFDSTSDHLPTNENNIIICAANSLADALEKDLNCHIHLTKNIPIGAGLGGGSSDAAATIDGLLQFWETDINQYILDKILIELGADVPACFYKKPCYFEDIGEIIKPVTAFPALHAILIYPNKHCATKDIFKNYKSEFSKKIELPNVFNNQESLFKFLRRQKNDLTEAARKEIPDIKDMLMQLGNDDNCLLTRMSGSGSACFGLYDSEESAHHATHLIHDKNPDWWVRQVKLK